VLGHHSGAQQDGAQMNDYYELDGTETDWLPEFWMVMDLVGHC
jgi:hypothetical protein